MNSHRFFIIAFGFTSMAERGTRAYAESELTIEDRSEAGNPWHQARLGMSSFSERHGYEASDAEITIRHDAPEWLRAVIVDLAYKSDVKPSFLRSELCDLLLGSPNASNWTEFPNVDGEVRDLISGAPWFFVYDLIERIHSKLTTPVPSVWGELAVGDSADQFTERINRAFRQKGVGWQLVDGKIEVRGPEVFEEYINKAMELTEQTGRPVARTELKEALHDLSRRPKPEITGAIQHAMAALECIAKDVTGQPSFTLGDWVKKNPHAFPQPLGAAVEKLWGHTSQYGRHVQEGKPADFNEAEMVVGLAGTLSVYLLRKSQPTC